MKRTTIPSLVFAFFIFTRWYAGHTWFERTFDNATSLTVIVGLSLIIYCFVKATEND